MKTMILIPAVLVLFLTGHGQTSTGTNDSGVVTYDDKMKLDIKLEGESAGYADMLPKERTEQKILYFTPDVSVYQADIEKKKPDDVEQEAGGAMVHVQMAFSDDKIYRDLKAHKKIEQREFMTRMFLIESDAGKADWKLTGAQKTILGFPCQEALREDDGKKIRAWYTPSITVSTGPQNFGNLPGLILSVDIDDGQRTITASSITFTPVDKRLMVKPKEGKKVTAEQFHKIVDAKMKEMGNDDGKGAHVVIRIQK